LRYEIQDEINMMTLRIVEEAYDIALKAEENPSRNQSQRNISRGLNRGKGVVYDKEPKDKDENGK
jgi:hypothetical protein